MDRLLEKIGMLITEINREVYKGFRKRRRVNKDQTKITDYFRRNNNTR